MFQSLGLEVHRYLPPNYKWITENKINTILDIGANTGQFAEHISKIIPNATIYSFEPLKECYSLLLETSKRIPKIKALNYALGEDNYETNINVSDHKESSSLLKMSDLHKKEFAFSANHHNEKITVRKLDEVAKEIIITPNLLIKIDVQGFEDKVIKGGPHTIQSAQIIIIEMSYQELYESQPLFNDIYTMLIKSDFVFWGNMHQTFGSDNGLILYSDSIFIKKGYPSYRKKS